MENGQVVIRKRGADRIRRGHLWVYRTDVFREDAPPGAIVSVQDERGVLILSELTGAAQELKDAVIINPYDADGFTRAIARAIEMPVEEQRVRMRRMRQAIAGRDVFVWAS